MAIDRDIGVAVARALGARSRSPGAGWEMTAATGVRGLRLLNESTLLPSLELTEANPSAFEVLERNARSLSSRGARARRWDARLPLGAGRYSYVDLDPYGSPAPFLDAALTAVAPEGIVAVTATDMRVLAGVERGAAQRRYGGVPLRGRLGPEAGLRILLAEVERRASRQGRAIEPLLCYVRDHHVRAYLFLRSRDAGGPSAVGVVDSTRWEGPRLPPGGPYGPMWLGPLFAPSLVAALEVPPTAAHGEEVGHLVATWKDEVRVDRPFFYESNELARALELPSPPPVAELLDGLRDRGWGAARTHARAGAFRTTAPRDEVESVARALARQSQNDRVLA